MLPKEILERIRVLKLDSVTDVIVRSIVSDAMDLATDREKMAFSPGEVPKVRSVAKTLPPDWPADFRDQFWKGYPNKKAKAHAVKALDKVAFSGKTRWADLMNGLERYIKSPDVLRGYVKHPATWINAECWKDEEGPNDGAPRNGSPRGGGPGFFEIAAGRE